MAIGIGDMTVTSYINQPLQASIAVLQPDGLLESEVIASLASPYDFDRLGLERHYSLNSLRFAADFSRASRPIIRVTTDDSVLEPYLSFLLELKWPERGYGESLLTGYAADQTLADAVDEADIYAAYGRHQHALDTLEAASAAEPSNASGLLKMLDIYMSLDRIDEARGLLALIEGTGDTVALRSATSRLDSHQASLSGDDAAHELASLGDAGPTVEASEDTLDISLDLELQEAAKPAPEHAEADASGTLDAEDPAETALDLALAYIDMGDKAGAVDLLQTVLSSVDEASVRTLNRC